MGPVRRGVILALLPGSAWAQSCEVQRPGWDGTPVTAMQEALYLAMSPAALILFVATLLVLRFKSQWGGAVVILLWTALMTTLTMFAPASRKLAMAEGCIGNPALFLGLITAICVAMIFYTAPAKKAR